MTRSARRLVIGTLLLPTLFVGQALGNTAGYPAALDNPSVTDCYTQVGPALRNAQGKMAPEVRDAYLTWAEQTVLNQLRQANQMVPPDCLAEVQRDETLRAAVFGSAFPPDPSILQNYARLRSRLGDPFLARYRSLVLAVSVARRIKGVQSGNGDTAEIGRDYQPDFWRDESLQAPGSEAEKAFTQGVADFLKQSRISAADLYQDTALQGRLQEYLLRRKIDASLIDQIRKSVWFGERLKYAMVLLGQRPAARESRPDIVAWVRYLAKRHESVPTSTPVLEGRPMRWPLFPIDKAPWPLLMPLAHPLPLSEADYIWAAFQGVHGDDRYHTYGPYRGDEDVIPDSLRPSRWFWDAWPDRIIHGGMCVPISKGTVDLYSALNKPAMWAGQPGHANLITFQYAGSTWTAEIEQAFAGGPDVTFAQWYFDEEPGTMHRFRDLYYWPGAEYHLGAALGMNVGLQSYMDTRIAVNLFRALPSTERRSVGVTLLQSALAANPYNPDLWYRLAEEATAPDQALRLAEAARSRDPGLLLEHSLPTQSNNNAAYNQYWDTLAQFVTRQAVLARSAPLSEADRRRTYLFLKSVPGIGAQDATDYAEKFARSFSGTREAGVLELEYDRNQATAGDPFGQLRMAQRYRDGNGVPQSDAKARELFLRAAGQGDPAAASLLGRLLPTVPADIIKVTPSSAFGPDQGAGHLVDGEGMLAVLHDNEYTARTMWHTTEHTSVRRPVPGLTPSPAWVRFDFARPMNITGVMIWNHNQLNLTDRGFRNTRLYGSSDGVTWNPLTDQGVIELPRAAGSPNALPVAIPVRAPARPLKSVIVAAEAENGNYGGSCYGLSAVRFLVPRLPEVVQSSAIQVTASSAYGPNQGEAHLIDGTGMLGLTHDNDGAANTMWHTMVNTAAQPPVRNLPPSPAWARFDFARPTRFGSLLIWNHNQDTLTNRGLRKVRIYGSVDGVTWRPLTGSPTIELPRAAGSPGAEPHVVKNSLAGQAFRSVLIAAEEKDGNYGGNCYGLSAVRFTLPPAESPKKPGAVASKRR